MSDEALLRELPSVDEVLKRPEVQAVLAEAPRWAVTEGVRRAIDQRRAAILAGDGGGPEAAVVTDEAVRLEVVGLLRPALRSVINATGVVVHTNLGRAPLSAAAFERLQTVSGGYSNLEYDLDGGGRGSRHEHLRRLAATVFGAEDAVVVNNNAAAVLLVLSSIASDREVVISRGELVEIGGGFRIPEVIVQGGARLREVGTTNRTRLADYEAAIEEGVTGALVKVHQSNFAIVGFTEEVSVSDLAALARSRSVPLVVDLGSGAMVERYGPGLGREPTVAEVVSDGAELVCFSGDKLLGGPQAGVVLGRADLVSRVRRHPLMRALRPGKLNLAALEATFELWRDGRSKEIPVARMLALDPAGARRRARRLARRLATECPGWEVDVVPVEGRAGGGTLPLGGAPGFAVALARAEVSAPRVEAALRDGDPPVIGRIVEDRVLLDLRAVRPADEADLLRRVAESGGRLDAENGVS